MQECNSLSCIWISPLTTFLMNLKYFPQSQNKTYCTFSRVVMQFIKIICYIHYIYYTLLWQDPTIIKTKYCHLKMKAVVQSSGRKRPTNNELGVQRPMFAFARRAFPVCSWNAPGTQWPNFLSWTVGIIVVPLCTQGTSVADMHMSQGLWLFFRKLST